MFPTRAAFKSLLGIGLLTLSVSTAAAAEEWRLRVQGQWVSSSAAAFDNEDLDEGYGAYVGLERKLGKRWGLEFGIGRSELEADQQLDIDFLGLSLFTDLEAHLEWIPLTVAANFHLTPDRNMDLYIAPRIGYAFVDDFEIRTTVDLSGSPSLPGFPSLPSFPILFPSIIAPDRITKFATDDTFIYGARLGLDWPLGNGGWGLSGSIDYTVMELEISDGGSLDLDPLAVGFGFSKSW